MEPVTLTVVVIYVADKFLSQFLKEEGYGNLKGFFFPKKKYRLRLEEIITQTINEFENLYPNSLSREKLQFYNDKILFDILNKHILFQDYNPDFLVEEFKSKDNIIVPKQDILFNFYKLFTDKINNDKILKELFFEENYKEKIFKVSDQISHLIILSNEILNKISEVQTELISASSQIQQLRNRFDTALEIKNGYQTHGLEVYPKIDKRSLRAKLVTDLITLYQTKTWIALQGSISIGKTQLAVLISEKFQQVCWIGFRDFDVKVILKVLFAELSECFKMEIETLKDLEKIIEAFHPNSIFVLDDLPKLDLNKEDLKSLIFLVDLLKKYKVKLLTTSNFILPQKIKEHFNETILEETRTPYLKTEEVKEILVSYGASEEVAEIWKELVCNTAEGHPTIVNAIGRFLEKSKWNFEDNQLKELFNGEYASSLEDEIYERIINTISDESSKELLYRFKIIIGEIKGSQINVISAVKPKIDKPFEKVNGLNGLWIQKIKSDVYEISPLVKKIKNNNLSSALVKALNNSLGLLILENKKLDQIDANHAIQYFINGNSYNKAGFVLTLVLEQSISNPNIFFNWGFNFFWLDRELPKEMDLFLKSVIRYFQIDILLKRNENIDFLLSDLEVIVEKASKAGINMAHAALLLSLQYEKKKPIKSNTYLILAISHFEQLKLVDKEYLLKEGSFTLENLVWKNLINVKSLIEFHVWFDSFSQLTLLQQQNSLSSELDKISSLIFCAKLFDLENEKQNPDWRGLILVYDEIISKALLYNLVILSASCCKYQIKCFFKINEAANATIIFNKRVNDFSINTSATFIINDELGRQLYYNKETELGIKYLLNAEAIEVSKVYTEKVDTYLALNEIFDKRDKEIAHSFILKAYSFQKQNEFVNEVLSAKIIGELAISIWEVEKQERKKVFYILEEGVEKILFTYKPFDDYQGTIIRYGHIINYFYHVLADLSLPDVDGQPYSIPFRSFLTLTNEKLLAGGFYFEQRKFWLAYIMFHSFELIEDFDMSKKWANLCFKLDDEEVLNPMSALLTEINIYNILEDKYEESILKEIKVLKAVNDLNSEKEHKDINPLLAKILENRPKIVFDSFDSLLFEYVINFIILRVLTNYLKFTNKEIILNFIGNLKNINNYFDDKTPLQIIETAFQFLIDDEKNHNDILLLENNQLELSTQLKVIIYLIASIKSISVKASLQIHFALIARLEMVSTKIHSSKSAYKLIVIPFFETFWKIQVDKYPDAFFERKFLVAKGLKKYEETSFLLKLQMLFKVLAHHLEYNLNEKEDSWLSKEIQ